MFGLKTRALKTDVESSLLYVLTGVSNANTTSFLLISVWIIIIIVIIYSSAFIILSNNKVLCISSKLTPEVYVVRHKHGGNSNKQFRKN